MLFDKIYSSDFPTHNHFLFSKLDSGFSFDFFNIHKFYLNTLTSYLEVYVLTVPMLFCNENATRPT